jgi:hypothetical protein
VLLIGDSLAVGLSTPMRGLCAKSGCDFQAIAEVSTTMIQWINEPRRSLIQSALEGFRPTLVLISLGTNDSAGNTPTDALNAQITKLRDWVQSSGAAIMWILPPKLNFQERVGWGVKAAGIESFPSANLPLPQPDGIHTTGRGYAGWAEHIWAKLTCSPEPSVSLQGLEAIFQPVVPSFMVPARPGVAWRAASTAAKKTKPRRRGRKRWKA